MCSVVHFFFFFKQKTAYELRISDWSSDVCSSDLRTGDRLYRRRRTGRSHPQVDPPAQAPPRSARAQARVAAEGRGLIAPTRLLRAGSRCNMLRFKGEPHVHNDTPAVAAL